MERVSQARRRSKISVNFVLSPSVDQISFFLLRKISSQMRLTKIYFVRFSFIPNDNSIAANFGNKLKFSE